MKVIKRVELDDGTALEYRDGNVVFYDYDGEETSWYPGGELLSAVTHLVPAADVPAEEPDIDNGVCYCADYSEAHVPDVHCIEQGVVANTHTYDVVKNALLTEYALSSGRYHTVHKICCDYGIDSAYVEKVICDNAYHLPQWQV